MASLRHKTISGLFWSFSESGINTSTNFIIGIILARLLSPSDFGIIGMIVIFIAISNTFIDSGFNEALIRKNNCGQKDYSTVFYFNLLIGAFLYCTLFISAPSISRFFNTPILIMLVRILSISLIINAFGIIQKTILIKTINFKLLTKISVISSIVSGTIGVWVAYSGFGIWALVIRSLVNNILITLLLWFFNRWLPSLMFSYNSLKEMFSFGSKLLIARLINQIYENIYYVIIGKYFSVVVLGYYLRADKFNLLISKTFTTSIQRVTYPVLSTIQNDKTRLKNGYKRIVKPTMLLMFSMMMGMAAIASPLIHTLLGKKWLPSVEYLQLLCFIGMLYPLHALNLNILNVRGKSDLFLLIEIIKKTLAIPIIIIGIYFGIKVMILCMIIFSFSMLLLNSYFSGKLINYPISEQLRDILPSFVLATTMSASVYFIQLSLPYIPIVKLIIGIVAGLAIIILLGNIFKMDSYKEVL